MRRARHAVVTIAAHAQRLSAAVTQRARSGSERRGAAVVGGVSGGIAAEYRPARPAG